MRLLILLALCGGAPRDPATLAQADRLHKLLSAEIKKPESERTLTPEMIDLGARECRRLLDEYAGKPKPPRPKTQPEILRLHHAA